MMYRQIKFRAWDTKSEYFKPIEEDGDYYFRYDENRLALFDKFGECEDVVLLQFTGLKDKNGKEIYTGDFVRQGETLYEIQDCIGGWDCQIWKEYKNGGAEEGSCYTFSCLLDTACEVVGNIYENADLIE